MTHEFDLVRASFASSWPSRIWAGLTLVLSSAWSSSALRTALKGAGGNFPRTAPALLRIIAIAVVVAAAMQPVLMWMMPLTVKPAMPSYLFVAIAALAAVAALRSAEIVSAWPTSWVARLRR